MSAAIDLDALILKIADRFKAHGMAHEVKALRAYYRQRRLQKLAQAAYRGRGPAPWTEDLVLQWAALWRIPPLDKVYPLLAKGRPCPCGATEQSMHTEAAWPEGHLLRCRACATTWLMPSEK